MHLPNRSLEDALGLTAIRDAARVKGIEAGALAFDPPIDPFVSDPVGWVNQSGVSWYKQDEVYESIRDNRYTAVPSCHDVGKSFSAANAIGWWIDSHPPGEAFAVSTAPTAPQVEVILWRELNRLHSRRDLPGYITGGSVPAWKLGGEIVAYGRKPADYDQAAFQGIHAKYVLVVIDEACGVPRSLFEAADALATNENSRVLAIGNPDDPTSYFEKVCRPGSGWNVVRISAFHWLKEAAKMAKERDPRLEVLAPVLVSEQWVNERKERWGEESAIYRAKVLGEFSEDSEDSIIPYYIAKRCVNLLLEDHTTAVPGVLGCDIARGGEDESTIVQLQAGMVEVIAKFREPDLMKVADRIMTELELRGPRWKAVVDGDGLGGGVIDRLRQRKYNVVEYRGSARARHRPSRFKNRRAEAWWAMRLLLQDTAISLPTDSDDADTLLRDLTVPRITRDAAGRIQVEPKDEIRKRLGHSPDLGDALVMAASEPAARPRSRDSLHERKRTGRQGITAGLLEEAM